MANKQTTDILPEHELIGFKTLDRFADTFGIEPRRLHEPRLVYLIISIRQGNGHCYIDNNYVALQEGTLLLVNPFAFLHLENIGYLQGSVILFTEAFFSTSHLYETLLYKVTYDPTTNGYFQLKDCEAGLNFINSNMSMFGWEFRLGQETYAKSNFLHTLLLNIILHLQKLQLSKSGKGYDTEEPFAKSKVVEFIQLLNQHFREEHAIEFYADKMNVPSKALTLICQKGIGWAPKAIIQSKLLTESKRLLLFDAGTPQDVSMELGFNDHAGFIIFFKKYMGVSPKDYRTEHNIKGQKGENSVA